LAIIFNKAILAPGALPWVPPVEGVFHRTKPETPVGESVQVGRDLVDKGSLAENIFAVGDAVQVPDAATGKPVLPLAGTFAMRQGITAAANIAGMTMEMPPATVWGVSVIFDLHWGEHRLDRRTGRT
jgi:NADPH-dependent 2,4-dienoyl-CoA reductase/sulfur reductase-like enzyme